MAVTLTPQLNEVLAHIERQLDATGRDLLRQVVQAATTPTELLALLQELATWQWKWKPVDVATFVTHPDYLGLNGKRGRIFPKLLDDLIELFESPVGYEQANMMGGIGWGKSTISWVALARMAYEVSCLANPQKTYGLNDGTSIAFLVASVSKEQARKVVFGDLKAALLDSPYFKEQFPLDAALKNEIRFPGDIVIFPAAGSEQGTVGYNVFGAVFDEINFWSVTEKSSLNRGQKYDQAEHVYNLMIRRIKSRFNNQGRLPGILLTVSSSKYPDDFTERRAAEVKQALADHTAHPDKPAEYPHPRTLVRRYSTWSTRKRESYLPETFWCYVGTSGDQPAIAQDRAAFADKDPERVIEVPMDFWPQFKADLMGSIRDSAGYPTLAIRPFLTDTQKIHDAFALGAARRLSHPFTLTETTLRDGGTLVRERLRLRENRRYYAHVDLALKKDAAGLAVGHIESWKTLRKTLPDGSVMTQQVPVIVIDLMLRITPPEGGEIGVDDVRALLLELREYGVHFKAITYDQYQSASSIQYFTSIGITSEKLSVDTTMGAYDAMKEALYEDRLVLYPYAPFLQEAVRLETKPMGKGKMKVDHPPNGSKDVCDAVAGVVYHCTLAGRQQHFDPLLGETEDEPEAQVPAVYHNLARVARRKGRAVTVDDLMWASLPDAHLDEDPDAPVEYLGFA